jgi:hypothetical protein
MKVRDVFRRALGRLPAPLAVVIGFAVFIAVSLMVAEFMPPLRDVVVECRKQCEPRSSRLVADKNYPMSAKGTYRQVCECY